MENENFTWTEKNFIYTISTTLGIRLMAMMVVMPLMSIYARSVEGSSAFLSGLALGAFGLTQAIFQIPFGRWSDKYGRKPMVLCGMVLLIIGLIIAGIADNIYLLIIGRAIQGCGGINAVAYAWIGDSILEQKRNYAMGILGAIGGIGAVVGIIAGPLLYKIISVSDIFYICAVIVSIACIYIYLTLHEKVKISNKKSNTNISIRNNFKDPNIIKLDFAIFLMSYTMIALFYIFPLLVEDSIGVNELWKVLGGSTIIGIIIMQLMIKQCNKGRYNLMGMLGFLFILVCGALLLINNNYIKSLGMVIYMGGYLYLTTILSSSVTKLAPKEAMGQVTGIFNMMQYIGSFIGGILSGVLWNINKEFAIGMIILIGILGMIIMKNVEIKKNIKKSETDVEVI